MAEIVTFERPLSSVAIDLTDARNRVASLRRQMLVEHGDVGLIGTANVKSALLYITYLERLIAKREPNHG